MPYHVVQYLSLSLIQENYGGVKVKLPRSLLEVYRDPEEAPNDEENSDEDMDSEEVESEGVVDGKGIQLDMNWNICKYLPEAGSCQDWFRVSAPAGLCLLHVCISTMDKPR